MFFLHSSGTFEFDSYIIWHLIWSLFLLAQCVYIFILDFRPTESSIKHYCLSMRLSVPSAFFSRMSFPNFLHDERWLEYLKKWQSPFSQENSFLLKFVKKAPKRPKNRFLLIFWKILSLVFPGKNLKNKLILSFIFYHQSHIWQNFGSWARGQYAVY